MDFEFSQEEKIFKDVARRFFENELKPIYKKIDQQSHIPKDFIKKMAEQGFLGILNSQKYGGSEASFINATIVAEEIGRSDISLATAVFYLVNTAWGYIFEKYAKEEIKEEIMPKFVKGEAFIGICSTEPIGGSDVASIKTTAIKKENHYVINGEKIYISGVREILENDGGLVTLVKTNPELKHKGISLFFLPIKGMKNVEVSYLENMGRTGISTALLRFKDSEIEEKYLLGNLNEGFYYAMEGFTLARILVAASCLGMAESVLEQGIEYIKNRIAFGKPIAKYEGIQFPLTELYTMIEASKLLVYKAAWLVDKFMKKETEWKEVVKFSAMSKMLLPQLALNTVLEVMKWHGALGYTKELGLEIGLRGVLSYYLGAEGTTNIMKIIIGREILGKEFIPYKD
jgi:acyl-CoA dehydrogenase